jgi:hypothetical protein
VIVTLVFEKNANCFAENWQKSQKIVIITSTPAYLRYTRTRDCLTSAHVPTYVDVHAKYAVVNERWLRTSHAREQSAYVGMSWRLESFFFLDFS